MNARIASAGDAVPFRQLLAVDLLRWTVRLGFAVAPRNFAARREREKRRRLRRSVPVYLHEDVGLPRDEMEPIIAFAIVAYLTR